MKTPASRSGLLALLFLLGLSLAVSVQAEIYKWTDDNGKTHYTATPPPDPEKGKNIKEDIDMAAGSSSKTSNTNQANTDTTNTERNAQNNSQERKVENNKNQRRTREAFCDSQQATLADLQANEVVRWSESNEEAARILSEKERQNKISQIEKTMTKACEDFKNRSRAH